MKGEVTIYMWVLLTVFSGAVGWERWQWIGEGPVEREGHSWELWDDYAVLFGGKSTEENFIHIPRANRVGSVNGTLRFTGFIIDPLNECDGAEEGSEEYKECYEILQGVYLNDLWIYNLACERTDDRGCTGNGWTRLDPGEPFGGCTFVDNEEICSHPWERYEHGAAISDDGIMFVYGGFAHKCQDFCDDMWQINITSCVTGGPCKWEDNGSLERRGPGKRWKFASTAIGGQLFIFGGQRIWHGLAQENSFRNLWEDTARFPFGGFLDDFWAYDIEERIWTQLLPRETCFNTPGFKFNRSEEVTCTIFWPSPRASAASSIYHGQFYLHGGFYSFFPYPHRDGVGAESGTSTRSSTGTSPYGIEVNFLKDFWKYDFVTGEWSQIKPAIGAEKPPSRRGHSLVTGFNFLVLFGGYSSNFFHNDFWIYNITVNRWIEKETFVHAEFPSSCTSDSFRLGDGMDFIQSRSVFGEPTRGFPVDGKSGRASSSVFVKQPRRRAPGWDGCRDRTDGRTDLTNKLQWRQPSQRENHRALFSRKHRLMLLFGGFGFAREQEPSVGKTHPLEAQSDLWAYLIDKCPSNCNNNGDCFFGFCYCRSGYYGVDCSNVTCPGDFCYMDEIRHQQHCTHCCNAEFDSEGLTKYVFRERKQSCSLDQPGTSNGICDGYGKCQCRPPFISEDCSTVNCPGNCSGNGYCSVEYPVSRCICDPGWTGELCDAQPCLNNCSYPNGECVEGGCKCGEILNPYNRSIVWAQYEGTDCSFVTAFAGGEKRHAALHFVTLLLACCIAVFLVVQRS